MRILPAVEEEIRRVIRDERAKDPLITVGRLEKALEAHFNCGFAYNYVCQGWVDKGSALVRASPRSTALASRSASTSPAKTTA